MPHIGLHMIPEEADLGPDALLVDAGFRIDLIRFDKGMASGKTAVGVAIPFIDPDNPEANTWLIAQTSFTALRAAVNALEAREEGDQ